MAFIDEVIPFANKDEATVYEHLKRALAFSVNHLGPHGLRQDFMRTGMTVCVWAKMESPRLLHCSFIMQ